MRMFMALALVGSLSASPLLARVMANPEISCISTDDRTIIRVENSEEGAKALVYHDRQLREELPCYENYQDEGENAEVYLYKCGTKGPSGEWDDTDSQFYIALRDFNPPHYTYAKYVGLTESKEMVCIR